MKKCVHLSGFHVLFKRFRSKISKKGFLFLTIFRRCKNFFPGKVMKKEMVYWVLSYGSRDITILMRRIWEDFY